MEVKEAVLTVLEKNRGSYWSGGSLARELKVSRNAIWKAIRRLQEQGYHIEGSAGKGYCLADDGEILSRQSIAPYLTVPEIRLEVFEEVTSTNTVLKQAAEQGETEGLVYVANRQTQGKGRRGRTFYSPADTGIYTSILLRPQMDIADSLLITTCAAVAVCKALEKHTGRQMQIKWVNDVYDRDKKVCGILTEGSVDVETGGLDYAILGIGINIFPFQEIETEQVPQIAGTILDTAAFGNLRSRITADVWNFFWEDYWHLQDRSFWSEYRKRLLWLGQEIVILDGKGQGENARVLDLNPDFSLQVQLADGRITALSSGEVSIRRS